MKTQRNGGAAPEPGSARAARPATPSELGARSRASLGSRRLRIDVRRETGGIVQIRVSGELDMIGAPHLRTRLHEEMARCRALVLDLGGVDFLGTDGLSTLLDAGRQAEADDVRWGIVATRHAVTHPLQAVGLQDVLPLHASVDGATTAVTSAD